METAGVPPRGEDLAELRGFRRSADGRTGRADRLAGSAPDQEVGGLAGSTGAEWKDWRAAWKDGDGTSGPLPLAAGAAPVGSSH